MKKLILILIVGSLFVGCAPVFSDLQSAKLVGKGNFELTPHLSSIYYRGEGADEIDGAIQTQYGVQMAYGLTEKIDFRSRIEMISYQDVKYRIISLGGKYSIISNRLSLFLPISFVKRINCEDCEIFKTIEPTCLFTTRINDYLDFNPSVKLIFPFFEEDADDNFGYAVNLGFGINKFQNWIIRPEVGILSHSENEGDGFYQHMSLGLSYRFGL